MRLSRELLAPTQLKRDESNAWLPHLSCRKSKRTRRVPFFTQVTKRVVLGRYIRFQRPMPFLKHPIGLRAVREYPVTFEAEKFAQLRENGGVELHSLVSIYHCRQTEIWNPFSTANLSTRLGRNAFCRYCLRPCEYRMANYVGMDCVKVAGGPREHAYVFPHIFWSFALLAWTVVRFPKIVNVVKYFLAEIG